MKESSPTIPQNWSQIRGCRAEVPRHVVFNELVSETVLLNIETGQYYGLNEVGWRTFKLLRQGEDLSSTASVLAQEFEGPLEKIRDDLVHYCAELVTRGLIELRGLDDSSV